MPNITFILHKPLLHFLVRASPTSYCLTAGDCNLFGVMHHDEVTTNKQENVLCRAEPEPCRASGTQSPGRNQDSGDRRQGHLPGNLSCSDYTMCLASLWAILPFCSVKYKRRSGKGKGLGKSGVWLTSLPRLNSLNQEPGFSFTQDVSLAWGHERQRREKQQC